MSRAKSLLFLLLLSLAGCYFDLIPLRLMGPAQINAGKVVNIIAGRTFAVRGGKSLDYDFFRPADTAGPLPLVILVHGGSWSSRNRTDMLEFGCDIAAQGFAAATIEYRLVNRDVIFPVPISDVLAAVRFFREQADAHQIDPQRIALVGESAGAHLALLAGLTTDANLFDPERPAGESPNVRAIVDLFGPTDFTVDPAKFSRDQISRVERFLGGSIDQLTDIRRIASPVTYVRADGPPVLIIHGDADSLVPVSQARLLRDVLTAVGQPHQYLEIPGMDHVPGAIWQGEFVQRYRQTLLDFLKANL